MGVLPQIKIGGDINYIAAYLTDYTAPTGGGFSPGGKFPVSKTQFMTASQWTSALNRLDPASCAPVALINGGPALHPEFNEIIEGLNNELKVTFVTSLQFDIPEFIKQARPGRFVQIHAGYAPETLKADEVVARSNNLKDSGFDITVIMPVRPDIALFEPEIRHKCESAGIDFIARDMPEPGASGRDGKLKWDDCCGAAYMKNVLCRTTGVLIAPDGNVYRCHSNLYNRADPVVHILSPFFPATKKFLPCGRYGGCDPADVALSPSRNPGSAISVDIIFEAETDEGE